MQLAKYMKLDQKGKVLAEYIWIDGSNGLRNKTKVGNPVSRPLPCLSREDGLKPSYGCANERTLAIRTSPNKSAPLRPDLCSLSLESA